MIQRLYPLSDKVLLRQQWISDIASFYYKLCIFFASHLMLNLGLDCTYDSSVAMSDTIPATWKVRCVVRISESACNVSALITWNHFWQHFLIESEKQNHFDLYFYFSVIIYFTLLGLAICLDCTGLYSTFSYKKLLCEPLRNLTTCKELNIIVKQ